MSRPRYTYTSEQLLKLRDSPLIKRPDNLPKIEQWIDPPTDQSKRTSRAQGGIQNGRDENDHPMKRPSPFEARQTSRQAQSGDDIFLGPKMSFASASAARQHNRGGNAEDKPVGTGEESKGRFDRHAARERGLRDNEGRERDFDRQGGRFGHRNGLQDEDNGSERRSRRTETSDRNKEGLDGGVALDGDSGRRNGPSRAKFDQPWFRDANKSELRDGEGTGEIEEHRSWRDRGRRDDHWSREPRAEQDPQWMKGPELDDSKMPTQEDFQKWKEKMKAGSAAAEQNPATSEIQASKSQATGTATPISSDLQSNPPTAEVPMFNLWGEPKRDGKGDGEPPTPKAAAKPRPSRFAGFFAPQETSRAPTEQIEPPPEASPAKGQTKNTAEDQEGFENIMQMLRMGSGSAHEAPAQLFGPPPPNQPREPLGAHDMHVSMEKSAIDIDHSSKRSLASFPPSQPPAQNPRLPSEGQQQRRPPPTNPDSEFLLKLMQQPRYQMSDAQAYSQQYSHRDADLGSPVSNMGSKPPELKHRPPPPGFFDHSRSYSGHQHQEGLGIPETHLRQPQMMSMDERFVNLPFRQNPAEEVRYQPAPPFDQPNLWGANRSNQPQSPQDTIAPPPGFPSARGPAPPGFFQFPGGGVNLMGQQYQQQGGSGGPQHQRGGMPPPPQPPPPQQPPGFYTNQPQGGPGVNHGAGSGYPPGIPPSQATNPQHARRPQVPPGYDGYGDATRRGPGPPMPPQPQYGQYMKQPGPYGGM